MKILLSTFILIFLVSCSSSDTSDKEDFVDEYINTLDTSVQSAREAANTLSEQQRDLQESIDNIQ
jgi:uncharacterized protein YlxW (UPF0749 family)